MSSNTTVLPNSLKFVVFTAAALMSVNAFAGENEENKPTIGDLKDMTSGTDEGLTSAQDELKAMLAKEEAAAQESTELDVNDLVDEAQDLAIPEAE